jgi:alanine racemase
LEPVMTFRSEIVMIHRLKIGESVSYGARWTAQRPSVVATVAVGYADGLNRALAHGGEMLYRGQRVPIAGTVCMDYTMIDITDAVTNKAPQVGEEVVIFGKQQGQFLKASEVASRLGTISYEVFVNISARVPREPK